MTDRSFSSKVLLFGEYSVIKNSMGLCTPYSLFEGKLTFNCKENKRVSRSQELKAFAQYLKQLKLKGKIPQEFDVKSFEFDISQGLYFDSTIPLGFGVGSSGALVAAVFDRYYQGDFDYSIKELKSVFVEMESHFHGSSSGIDPLISYTGKSILIKENGDHEVVDLPSQGKGKGGIFLLNTGRPRRTEPLVNLFLEKCSSKPFSNLCQDVLLPLTNSCVSHFLSGEIQSLISSFEKLSAFQYQNFSPMIPTLFRDLWEQGLDSGLYNLKLCGAGGGGFLLGITKDFDSLGKEFDHYEIRPLFKF